MVIVFCVVTGQLTALNIVSKIWSCGLSSLQSPASSILLYSNHGEKSDDDNCLSCSLRVGV